MSPAEFLSRLEPVLQSLFEAIARADTAAESERRYLGPKLQHHANEFERWSAVEEFDDERLVPVYARMAEAHQALKLIDTTASAAAGAILQTAKQCIAMAWDGSDRFCQGRLVGTQHLSAVIWYARNQAQHFDEGPPTNPRTREALEKLSNEKSLDISNLSRIPRSLARDVLRILGWDSYEAFAIEMVNLLQSPNKLMHAHGIFLRNS